MAATSPPMATGRTSRRRRPGQGRAAGVAPSFDVLSDALQVAPLRGWDVGESSLAAPWGVRGDAGSAALYCILEGDCWLEIEPLSRGTGFEFVDKIFGGSIPRNFIPAVEKGVVEALDSGPLAGFPVVDVKVTLYDGSFHTVDSSELAFKLAGRKGFRKGILECKPTLLEPIMNAEITAPDEYMGDIIGDLNARRGRVAGVDSSPSGQVIKAKVPMAEMMKYSSDLRSMTQGRGSFDIEFDHFEEVPAQIAEKIIAQHKKEQEEEDE